MWNRFFDTLLKIFKEHKNYIIFAHNLGSFDGFIFIKGLINISKPDEISTIIEKEHKFIQINVFSKKKNVFNF